MQNTIKFIGFLLVVAVAFSCSSGSFANSSANIEAATDVSPDSVDQRISIQDLPVVYIDSLGAAGDGKTDDSRIFQRAFEKLTNGGSVILGNKSYYASININKANITLRGSGKNSTLWSEKPRVVLVSAHNVTISDLSISGIPRETYGVLILVRAENCMINECKLFNGKSAIDTENGANPFISTDLRIENCQIRNLSGYAIHIRNPKNTAISDANALISGNTIDSCHGAINFDCVGKVTVKNNLIKHTISSNVINNQDRPVGLRDIIIQDNTVMDGLPRSADFMELQQIDGLLVQGNKFINGGNATAIQISYARPKRSSAPAPTVGYNKNIIIRDNEIVFNGSRNPDLSYAGIKLIFCQTVSIINNKITYDGDKQIVRTSVGVSGIVLSSCDKVIIQGNTFNSEKDVQVAKLKYGISVYQNNSDIFINDNSINHTELNLQSGQNQLNIVDDPQKFAVGSSDFDAMDSTGILRSSAKNKFVINSDPQDNGVIGWRYENGKLKPIATISSDYIIGSQKMEQK